MPLASTGRSFLMGIKWNPLPYSRVDGGSNSTPVSDPPLRWVLLVACPRGLRQLFERELIRERVRSGLAAARAVNLTLQVVQSPGADEPAASNSSRPGNFWGIEFRPDPKLWEPL